ncbi:type II and III secretion system protein family protein [Agarilytica rhodophyticola]|uniref:type II and III secretion system protein family protein n=1 Tax=Agarilytica rhodophyticola TaxID=1737490 RepID=UPI000B342859|nr:pilus assembly protein N-terminal domain-containing protein [Agarilytica rhodophyticola]
MKKVVFVVVFIVVTCSASFALSANYRSIEMHLGEVKVLDVPDVEQVAIGDEKIVLYRPLENGEMILIGAGLGQTNLHVWQKGGRQRIYKVSVINQDVSRNLKLARYLAENIAGLKVSEKDNRIVFSGNVSISQKDNFLAILGQFSNPISLVTYSSFVFQPVVRIDVTLLEIKQRAVRDLGIDWDDAISGPIVGVHRTFSRNDFFRIARDIGNDGDEVASGIIDPDTGVPNDYNFYSYGGLTTVLGSIINLLEETGDAEVISSPRLMAKSGESASFLSGGEFPVAVLNNQGQVEVEFKQYGVRLEISPQVDSEENINTLIFTELSSIDFANVVNGVPGLVSRNSETTVNLRHGETYAISGLALAEKSEQNTKVPFLGDIPYLGQLFRSTNTDADSTELVIMVTPYLVTPDSKINKDLIEAGNPIRESFKNFDWKTKILE